MYGTYIILNAASNPAGYNACIIFLHWGNRGSLTLAPNHTAGNYQSHYSWAPGGVKTRSAWSSSPQFPSTLWAVQFPHSKAPTLRSRNSLRSQEAHGPLQSVSHYGTWAFLKMEISKEEKIEGWSDEKYHPWKMSPWCCEPFQRPTAPSGSCNSEKRVIYPCFFYHENRNALI